MNLVAALEAFNRRRLLPFATLDDLRRDISDPSHAERKAEDGAERNWKERSVFP